MGEYLQGKARRSGARDCVVIQKIANAANKIPTVGFFFILRHVGQYPYLG
jgi:hypothetical protein